MIVAKLTVGFDRGAVRNTKEDIVRIDDAAPNNVTGNIVSEGGRTADGGIIRGLGTHYVSEEARATAERCEAEERRIRSAFNRTFVAAPIPGVYLLPDRHSGATLLASLAPSSEVAVRCAVYDLSPHGTLPPAEIAEWTERVKKQLAAVPLGRAENAAAEGLDILDRLAACPVLAEETRLKLRELIAGARIEKIQRVDFKRRLGEIKLDVVVIGAPQAAPRRGRVAKPAATPSSTQPVAAV